MTEPRRAWYTPDEIRFIEHLPRETLRKYLLAARQRVTWDGLDKARILAHARAILRGSE